MNKVWRGQGRESYDSKRNSSGGLDSLYKDHEVRVHSGNMEESRRMVLLEQRRRAQNPDNGTMRRKHHETRVVIELHLLLIFMVGMFCFKNNTYYKNKNMVNTN